MDIRRHKLIILFFSFIFIGVYSAALVYAVTYVTPGSVLDPSGTPGNYTVGFATAANEVLYTNDSNQLTSDDGFLRKPTLIDQPDQTIGTTAFSEVSNTADSDNISLVGIGGGLIVTDNFNRGLNGTYIGVVGEVVHQGTGTLSTANGNLGVVINSSTGIVSDARGTTSVILNIGGGTLTNGYAFYASTIQATNKYGVYIDADDTVNVLRELQLSRESPLKWFDASNSHFVAFKAMSHLTTDTTYILPENYGNEGDNLTFHTGGTLTWETPSVGGDVQILKVSLSSAEILSSHTSPVELIPAPGAGKIISLLSVNVRFNSVSSPYNFNGRAYGLIFSGASSYFASVFSGLEAILDSVLPAGLQGVSTDIENSAIQFYTDSEDPVGGDSTLDIYFVYTIIDL